MNRISINNVVYESEYNLSIRNNKVICDGPYKMNGKLYNNDNTEQSIPEEEFSVSKKYDVSDIKALYNNLFSIKIDIDPNHEKEELIITAPESTHNKIAIEFNRSNLNIDSKRSGTFGQISITLRAKSLEKIVNTGTGDITGSIIAKDLVINNEGVGSIKLQGSAHNLKLDNSGVGSMNTLDLLAQQVSFDLSGVGSLKCTSKVLKKSSLSGVGSVKYHADEQAHISKSGLGSVKYLGAKVFDSPVVQKPLKVEPDLPKKSKEKEVSFDDLVDSVQKDKTMSQNKETGLLGNLAKKFKKLL